MPKNGEAPNAAVTVGHEGLTRRGLLRRGLCAAVATCGAQAITTREAGGGMFDFSQVCDRARQIAGSPYRPQARGDANELAALNYDEYRKIRFRPECAIWRNERLPFQVQLLHRGFLFPQRVRINLVEDGRVTPVPWHREWFNYGTTHVDPAALPDDLGYAGFRVHFPLNRPDYYDELIVFLGASYFRAVARDLVYGASCRGLAVDIGMDRQEEFPEFSEFWLVRPAANADRITIRALLDGPSVSGAYEFCVHPGATTQIDVNAILFSRRRAQKVAVAPITTMFLRGEETEKPTNDFRPEVHDSDGLLMTGGTGEWLWRPLVNPRKTRLSRFSQTQLRGFGLLQRDRQFASYLDREAHYDRRPSIWIEPTGPWPGGAVELFEYHLDNETAENVNAYWVLTEPSFPADGLRFQYRIVVLPGDPPAEQVGKSIATRCWATDEPSGRQYTVDFDGPTLRGLGKGAAVEPVLSVSGGRAENAIVRSSAGPWRLSFRCRAERLDTPVEMRAFLRTGAKILTETWSEQWNPS